LSRSRWLSPLHGFFLAAAILVGVGVFAALSAVHYTRDGRWVTHTYQVLTRLESVSALESRAVSEQRGYLLTHAPEAQESFFESGVQARVEADQLIALVADNPAQVARAEALRTALAQRLEIAHAVALSFDREGLSTALARMQAAGSARAQDEFDRKVHEIHAEEQTLLVERTRTMERLSLWVFTGVSLGIVTSFLILASIYSLLSRENRERLAAEERLSGTNAQLNGSVARLERLSADLSALGRYAGMLQSATEVHEAIEITRQSMRSLAPELAGTVYLTRSSRDHAEAVASWGEPIARSDPTPSPEHCWALRRNQVYVIEDLRSGVRCAHVELPAGDGAGASACIPLAAQGEHLGWMHLTGPSPLPALELAINVCEQLSLGLASLRLKETLRHQAIRDPLTGLFNRRYMEESLTRELARCKRKGGPLAVMMFDVDQFKRFNDTNGHTGGDALLSAFGQLLRASCRAEDIPCRYGGEEFTVILPDAPIAVALERAEAIRRSAAELDVQHQGRGLPRVTVSIGVATTPEHGETGLELLEAADKALYAAKSGGRNRVIAATRGSGESEPKDLTS
jgi:diguanylate cyclase (GGDEF)-like protein